MRMKIMNRFLFVFVMLVLVLFTTNSFAQNPNFYIYLCFGQSNMEGSASIEEQDKAVAGRFKMMASTDCPDMNRRLGEWYTAQAPLSQCWAGLSPADYFGRSMIANLPDSVEVGVISVAVGGCDIRLFDKELYLGYDSMYGDWFIDKVKAYGGNPYQRLVDLAVKAKKDGVIKGILLHQGETNNGDEQWPEYVKVVYNNLLADLELNAESVPLLAGELVHADQGGICADMNPIINTLPELVPTAFVIASKGCDVREDSIHFNSAGVRKLGKRYAEKMLELEGCLK